MKDRQRDRLGARKTGSESERSVTESETERKDKRETETCPCDSADLTGLGLSAAVPLAFVRIAGENSIPV